MINHIMLVILQTEDRSIHMAN
uniref:Uncharacterized protein n=1 Tax=Arundo donax TaxID=35708 RepID=A0A0A9HVD4_ARUDO